MGRIEERRNKAWEKYAATLSPLERLPPQYEAAFRAFHRAYDVGTNDVMDVMEVAMEAGKVEGAALVAKMRAADGRGIKIPYR